MPATSLLDRLLPHRCCVLALAAAVAGCTDSPIGPESYVHRADGSVWVAVALPAGTPEPRSWLPYLDPAGDAAAHVRSLRDEAGRARRAGRLERWAELEDEALRAAAGSLARSPEPRALLLAAAALESWERRAHDRLATGSFPELAGAAARVREAREQAREALAAGDTAAAVLRLTHGAREARAFAPVAVALRLLARAEARIDGEEDPSENLKRARNLLLTAREAMATGDEARALRRAMYALQLIEMENRRSPAGGRRARP